ncbi:CpaF family protein [Nitriliruptoraceae bacterium ZYF776]|nr:CpaF family protein [Profundirhabdus halotolerans]
MTTTGRPDRPPPPPAAHPAPTPPLAPTPTPTPAPAARSVAAPTTSPLAEIEARALARAKDEALDLGDDAASVRLKVLLEDEVVRWRRDHDAGRRPFDLPDPQLVVERAHRNLAGYGPLAPLLADDDVWEIMINAPDQILVRRHRGVSGYHDEAFHDDDHVLRTLTKLLDDAATAHRTLDPSEGLQDAQLDDGSRLHIVHRDVGRGGHLLVNIRRFTGIAFRSLDQLVGGGMLSPEVATLLRALVASRASIVVAGAPGAGKTTLLACLTAELDPALRVVTAEEVFELDVPLPNVAAMQTRPGRPDRPEVDLRRLVAGFLRMAPDVAIVGEVRDREALPLLLTLSSGVTGYTTIHAGDARQALTRLRFICQLADTRSELPLSALTQLVSGAVDVVVHVGRVDDRPTVTEVVAVEDVAGDASGATFTTTPLVRAVPGGGWRWTGALPSRVRTSAAAVGIDLLRCLEDVGGPDGGPGTSSGVGGPASAGDGEVVR